MRLLERIAAPRNARGQQGDRAAAEAALGYAYPAWDVVEHYGDGRWLDWLLVPSPHLAHGIETLVELRPAVGGRLIAFSDPEGTFIYADDHDDRVHVLVDGALHATGLPFADMLEAWLDGALPVLPPVAELTGDPAVPPYFAPDFDPTRKSHIVWVDLDHADTARWFSVLAMFGGHVVMNRQHVEGRLQERLYIPALEAQIVLDLINRPQLHVSFYEDRRADVRSLVYAICAAAGMTIAGTRGTRGTHDAL